MEAKAASWCLNALNKPPVGRIPACACKGSGAQPGTEAVPRCALFLPNLGRLPAPPYFESQCAHVTEAAGHEENAS